MQNVLDLERYPLDKPDSAEWKALVARCKADLERDGMFNLEGLMTPDAALGVAQGLENKFKSESFRHEREHNIYFLKNIPDLPKGHPAGQTFLTSNNTLCEDQVANTAVKALYDWPAFARFLAATMDKPALYQMEDPLAGLNVMSYHEGQALNWHFDRSEFTTTMLLQAPDKGGDFAYRTDLRSDTDPNYDGVAKLLNGDDPDENLLHLTAGTLNVFRGKNTAHRVTPVKGPNARVIAVFSFYEEPGVSFSEEERIGFYGRA